MLRGTNQDKKNLWKQKQLPRKKLTKKRKLLQKSLRRNLLQKPQTFLSSLLSHLRSELKNVCGFCNRFLRRLFCRSFLFFVSFFLGSCFCFHRFFFSWFVPRSIVRRPSDLTGISNLAIDSRHVSVQPL